MPSVYRLWEDQTSPLRFMVASFHQAEKSSIRKSYLKFLAQSDIPFMSASPPTPFSCLYPRPQEILEATPAKAGNELCQQNAAGTLDCIGHDPLPWGKTLHLFSKWRDGEGGGEINTSSLFCLDGRYVLSFPPYLLLKLFIERLCKYDQSAPGPLIICWTKLAPFRLILDF